jgi:hypothetical protein
LYACRWGNSRSPAYGTLSDYQFMRRHTSSDKRKDAARAAWGAELAGPEDVADVFVRYCKVRPGYGSCCLFVRAVSVWEGWQVLVFKSATALCCCQTVVGLRHAKAAWGAELAGPKDMADVFVRYCKVWFLGSVHALSVHATSLWDGW